MKLFIYIGMCFVGVFFILLGFRIYKPEQTERWVATYAKWGWLFKYGGIGILFWNVVMLAVEMGWV